MNTQIRMKIYGPPGSGKTKTAIDMMLDAIHDSGTAAFASFTQKARDEAKNRIPQELKKRVQVRTIHSLAFRSLGYRNDYVLTNLSDFAKFVGEAIEEEEHLGLPRTRLKDILAFLGTWRNKRVKPTLSDFPKNIPYKLSEFIIKQYYVFKEQQALVDYTDILTRYIKQEKPLEVDYFFIDEAQDLTKLHWIAIEKMARNCSAIYVFGDDDQAIFAWAGSEAENLMNWESTATKILNYSHRLPKYIYRLSQDVIRQVAQRARKDFQHNAEDGIVERSSTIDFDRDFVGFDSYAVLYRNHSLANWVREALHARGIPYRDVNSPYNYTDDLTALVSWEKWREGLPITVRQLRKISKFTDLDLSQYDTGSVKNIVKGKPPTTLPWHEVISLRHANIYRLAYNRYGIAAFEAEPKITLSTIHHAKGGEWDKVILLTDMSKLTHEEYLRAEKKDNEHRVWYVGTTRARKHLQLIKPKGVRHYSLLADYPLERLL